MVRRYRIMVRRRDDKYLTSRWVADSWREWPIGSTLDPSQILWTTDRRKAWVGSQESMEIFMNALPADATRPGVGPVWYEPEELVEEEEPAPARGRNGGNSLQVSVFDRGNGALLLTTMTPVEPGRISSGAEVAAAAFRAVHGALVDMALVGWPAKRHLQVVIDETGPFKEEGF
jgi:hypothetical protein